VIGEARPLASPGAESRARAARAVHRIVHGGRRLEETLLGGRDREHTLVHELVSTTIRYYPALERLWTTLRSGPEHEDDPLLRSLGLVGLAQLLHTRIPDHAAVSATVEASRLLGCGRGAPVLNAVLRRALRERRNTEPRADEDPVVRYAHPAWWIDRLRKDWPEAWERLLLAGLERAPMTLRVNLRRTTVAECRKALEEQGIEVRSAAFAPAGLVLVQPRPAASLAVYNRGWVSVQDEAAQLAVPLLAPDPGDCILDACCAPGNKLAQIVESAPDGCRIVGLDVSARRLDHTRHELERLGHTGVTLCRADAAQPDCLADHERFSRILLDAPCTASGTVRRHPDVKVHRRTEDVAARAELARRLLDNLWNRLEPGGRLLFSSCSIFRDETHAVVGAFLEARAAEAVLHDPHVPWGHHEPTGVHVLTGEEGMDGFFYAILLKRTGTYGPLYGAAPLARRGLLTDTRGAGDDRTRPLP
jgi:16S rRNA (cytosine967-C5)-methyltransferase